MGTIDSSQAVESAKGFLLREAEAGFAETTHEMTFPHFAGFTGATEQQASDVFARAVLASVLLDIAELEEQDQRFKATVYEIAHRESQYIAEAKLADRAGGWSYFPGLPELPPDVDSLAAALRLFERIAPEYSPLCEEPVNLVLNNIKPDGSVKTWIVAPANSSGQRQAMIRGIERYWGSTVDVEVCARFFAALLTYNKQEYSGLARQGAEYILSRQHEDGTWNATWYWGRAYGTGLCLHLLDDIDGEAESAKRAADFFIESQREDGGWGWDGQTIPLETAFVIWLIIRFSNNSNGPLVAKAGNCLMAHQALDGSWDATPWIKMELGRVNSKGRHILSYQSTTLTTAFCLRSLLLLRNTLN
jgi:squalene-hopene/tetraprenyl-beta-curcumene cyclase